MATSETAKLLASLELKDKFTPTIKKANSALGKFDAKLSASEGRAYRAGQQIGTGFRNIGKLAVVGMGIVATNVALGLNSLIELEKQTAQTEAVIKSTGGVAGQTAQDINRLAEAFESVNATVGDEVIREGANLLLTFTNIREKAFEPTLQAALDMNTGLGKGPEGLTNTVKVLGKALNDPKKGLGALSKAGITFDAQQTKRIKKLQAEGKLFEAQEVILGEINKRFAGRFEAEGGTTGGKVAKALDSIEDLQRLAATAALPAVGNMADALSDLLADPEIQRGAENLGKEIGNLFSKENVKTGAKALGDVFKLMRDAAPAIKTALGTVGTVLGGAVKFFTMMPDWAQALLVGGFAANKLTGGLVTNIAGGIFGALKAMTVQAGIVHLSAASVTGIPGGAPGPAGAAGAAAKGGLGLLSKVFLVGEAIGLAALVLSVQQGFSQQSTEIAGGLKQTLDSSIHLKTLPQLKTALDGVNQGITDLQSNPLHALVQGDALVILQQMRADLIAQVERINALKDQADRTKDDTVQAQNRTRDAALETKREAQRGLAIVRSQTQTSGSAIQGTTRSSAAGIEAAIRSSRPIISVDVDVSSTNVTRVNTKTTRSGPTGGSRNADSSGSGTLGNGGR